MSLEPETNYPSLVSANQAVSFTDLKKSDLDNELRNDGLATTYFAPDGSTLVIPHETHDFRYSQGMSEVGLSVGHVVTTALGDAIQYDPDVEILSFANAFNASIGTENGVSDIKHIIDRFMELWCTLKNTFGLVPIDLSIYSIAYDKTNDGVEFLPPYSVGEGTDIKTVMNGILADTIPLMNTPQEENVLTEAFNNRTI